jgi:hypothetical protein
MNGRQYIRFTGVDRRGVSRVGCLHAGDPAQLAERLFDKGYRSASITNFQGEEVAAYAESWTIRAVERGGPSAIPSQPSKTDRGVIGRGADRHGGTNQSYAG